MAIEKKTFLHLYLLMLCLSFNRGGVAQEEQPPGVVIERTPINLTSPEKYQVSLTLRPVRSVPVVAPTDGIIQDVFVKPGQSVAAQSELIRLDSQEFSLALKKAQASHELAKLVLSQASSPAEKQIAQAKQQITQAELNLAQFRIDQTIIRAPISGVVNKIQVTPGQYVRAGDLLLETYDPNQLYIEVPAERSEIEVGATVPLTVEAETAQAVVDAVLPPLVEFDPLRELFVSVATARLLIDASKGDFTSGQAVSSKMIPRHPIAEIRILAVQTAGETAESERSVQVIREGFVRTVPVQVLGQVGQTHVFVSGRFTEGDELVISASEPLEDGAWIRPLLQETRPAGSAPNTVSPQPRSKFPTPSGF